MTRHAPSHTQNSIDGTGSVCAPQRRASDGHRAYDVWDEGAERGLSLDVHRPIATGLLRWGQAGDRHMVRSGREILASSI